MESSAQKAEDARHHRLGMATHSASAVPAQVPADLEQQVLAFIVVAGRGGTRVCVEAVDLDRLLGRRPGDVERGLGAIRKLHDVLPDRLLRAGQPELPEQLDFVRTSGGPAGGSLAEELTQHACSPHAPSAELVEARSILAGVACHRRNADSITFSATAGGRQPAASRMVRSIGVTGMPSMIAIGGGRRVRCTMTPRGTGPCVIGTVSSSGAALMPSSPQRGAATELVDVAV